MQILFRIKYFTVSQTQELVSEMIKMSKELKSQNERIQFQEKRIDNQDRKILLLESRYAQKLIRSTMKES